MIAAVYARKSGLAPPPAREGGRVNGDRRSPSSTPRQ